MTKIFGNFFVIFVKHNVIFMLLEFESDRMTPRESAKNGQIGARELKCKIFVDSEVKYEIYDKNYPRKKSF